MSFVRRVVLSSVKGLSTNSWLDKSDGVFPMPQMRLHSAHHISVVVKKSFVATVIGCLSLRNKRLKPERDPWGIVLVDFDPIGW